MILQIQHTSDYLYEESVSLSVHRFYFLPQFRPHLNVKSQNLIINPTEQGMSLRLDLAGNSYHQVWFEHLTATLSVKSELEVECTKFNPFGFIVDPKFKDSYQLSSEKKFQYPESDLPMIQVYLNDSISEESGILVSRVWDKHPDLLTFLVELTALIHSQWKHLIREEEDIWPSEKTFNLKSGSCRDLAWMEMNMIGELGLASRFVSGYAFNPELNEGHELHAWLEVYLPGAGWVGLDPSLGLLTDQFYIPLAVHPDPRQTLPVQGTFAGKGGSTLKARVEISVS